MATDRIMEIGWQYLDQQYQVLNHESVRTYLVLGQNDWQDGITPSVSGKDA